MPKKQKEMPHQCMHPPGCKMWFGIVIFIFGAILWWTLQTYGALRWDIAFMVAGILMVLKGFYIKSKM